ncbi:MAG: zf-TFIIB domain-containing protein [bacterium]
MPKTKKCRHCKKDVNIKYTVCPLCGGDIPEKADSLPPECPRCKKPLEPLIMDEDEYDLCPECGGLWLDRLEFHRATRESTVYREVTIKKEYMREPSKDSAGYIPCVRCGKLMIRENFGKISGVLIDQCGKHGVWLDGGELEKIRHFIADGGLEKSQDREIEKNRAKLKEIAQTVQETAFTQRLIHFWNPKRWLFRDW